MSEDTAHRKDVVQAVGRGLHILRLLAAHGELQVAQVCRLTGLRKSTAHRFLTTMQDLGYVEQNHITRAYRTGVKALELALLIQRKTSICELARPYLDRLAHASRETCNLAILDGRDVLYLDKRESPEPLAVTAKVGDRKPAHCTALGKAILAFLPPERLEGYLSVPALPAATVNSITDPKRLRDQLLFVRAERVAYDREEVIPGVCCVASPVLDHTGHALAAISVSVPSVRMTAERERALAQLVKDIAAEVSTRIGGSALRLPG